MNLGNIASQTIAVTRTGPHSINITYALEIPSGITKAYFTIGKWSYTTGSGSTRIISVELK